MKHRGFTLAETLITLAIIGVVAGLTIPVVIRSYQEQQTVAKVRKFYSEINQALQKAEFEKGKKSPSGLSSDGFVNFLKPYMNIVKICETNDKTCFYEGTYKQLSGKTGSYYSSMQPISAGGGGKKFILKDGQHVAVRIIYTSCGYNGWAGISNFCGELFLDTNGPKPPNQWGKDAFMFGIAKEGIIPYGMVKHWSNPRYAMKWCRKDLDNRENGLYCTAWVIVKGNMDYLRKDVNW